MKIDGEWRGAVVLLRQPPLTTAQIGRKPAAPGGTPPPLPAGSSIGPPVNPRNWFANDADGPFPGGPLTTASMFDLFSDYLAKGARWGRGGLI